MVELYSGTPGSGKSLHVARRCIACARFGRPVIGNVPMQFPKYSKSNYMYVPNSLLSPQLLMDYSRSFFNGSRIREGAILLVIDECQMMFNSREWQQRGRNDWLGFFTHHRHYGYDIVLVAQFDRMVDRQIRSLIEYEFIHRKLSNFGLAGKVFSILMGGNTFVCVQMWYPLKEKIGSEFFHARKALYSCYDSYADLEDMTGVELGTPAARKAANLVLYERMGISIPGAQPESESAEEAQVPPQEANEEVRPVPICGAKPGIWARLSAWMRQVAINY